MGPILRKCIHFVLGEYQIFRIFRCDLNTAAKPDLSGYRDEGYQFREVSIEDLAGSSDDGMRARARYAGEDALAFGVFRGGELLCLQWYWFRERYKTRNFWPLQPDQAKSIDLYTLPAYRGTGLATALKLYSAAQMKEKGFNQVFSRIWYNHVSSRRVSEKAGWHNIAIVVEVFPLGLGRKIRWVRRLKEAERAAGTSDDQGAQATKRARTTSTERG